MPLIETKLPDDAKIAISTQSQEGTQAVPVLLAISIPLDEASPVKDDDLKNAPAFSSVRFSSMMELFKRDQDNLCCVNVAPPTKPSKNIHVAPYALIGSAIQRFALASRQLVDHPAKTGNLLALDDNHYLTQQGQKKGDILLKYRDVFLAFADQSHQEAKKYTKIWMSENQALLTAKQFNIIDYDQLTQAATFKPIFERLLQLFVTEDSLSASPKKQVLQIAVMKDANAFVGRETERYAAKTLGLKKISEENKAKIRMLSVWHFIEETAAMLVLWAEYGINIALYPGKVFETLHCILEESEYKKSILDVIRIYKPNFDQPDFDQPDFQWHHLRVNINHTVEDKQAVEKKSVDTGQEKKLPISIIHDVTGHIKAYDGLIKGLHQYHIIPICNPGNSQQFQQFNNLAEAAKMHGEHILQSQKHGPYYIVGYSHGATVGAALAEYLKKQGHNVHLIIIDAFSPSVILQLSDTQYTDYLLMIMQSFVAQLGMAGYKVMLNTLEWGQLKTLPKQEQIKKLSDLIILQQQDKAADFQKELDIVKSNLLLGLTYQIDDSQNNLGNILVFYTEQLNSLAQKFSDVMQPVYGWARYNDDLLDSIFVNGKSNHSTIMTDPHVSKILDRILGFLSPNLKANADLSPQNSPPGSFKELKSEKKSALVLSSESLEEDFDPEAMKLLQQAAKLLAKKSSMFGSSRSAKQQFAEEHYAGAEYEQAAKPYPG